VRHLVAAILMLTLLPAAALGQTKETPLAGGRTAVSVQGQRYGTLGDSHAMTMRVREIFQRIVRAAGRRPGVAFEVRVFDTPRVIAEAFPGGLVVVSTGLVDLAGADDSALAFVLAHEIAHLLRDHHAILDSLGVLGATVSADPTAVNEHVARAYQVIELDADRLGVLFAALAGYSTAAAIPTVVALTERSGPDLFHPNPKERASAIREKLAEIGAHIELFHAGLCLLNVGRSLEAARVLEHFLTLFPSREVLSLVGVAYHREALRYATLPAFRHVLVVDAATRAPVARGGPSPSFRALLDRAVHYYTLAVDADPQYGPALNNLGAVYLDLGERELALGYINRALKHAPMLAAAYVNRGVASSMVRDHMQAAQDWRAAFRIDPRLRAAALNLAALSELRGQADLARQWRERAGTSAAPPDRAEAVARLTPGTTLDQLSRWLEEPGVRRFDVPLGGTAPDFKLMVLERRGVALLARGNTVEAVGALHRGAATTAGLRPGDTVQRVRTVYGVPSAIDDIHAMSMWAYSPAGMAIVVANDRVQSVWVGRRSDR
jgi:tetratricopeptide (TPR) repeat protein